MQNSKGTDNTGCRQYFVSPDGSDASRGTEGAPFATLGMAARVAEPGDRCVLRAGVYRETLRPVRSGTADAPITFEHYPGEKAIITGADRTEGWKKEADGSYSAPLDSHLDHQNQVFCDGVMLVEACWPHSGGDALFHPARAVATGGSANTLVCDSIPGSSGCWKGAQLWCAGGQGWICWTANVTAYDATTHTLTIDEEKPKYYPPRTGSLFGLRGVRSAWRHPGQWLYDVEERKLRLFPPAGRRIQDLTIEVKRRVDAIDLSGRSHICIQGLQFCAGGIRTDETSSDIQLVGLHGRYVSHSYAREVSEHAGVLIRGRNLSVVNCDLGYSSSSVLSVAGCDHRIINCYLHHGGYAGLWKGAVSLCGRRIVFSHNTVCHSGRDLVTVHGLMESVIQYNELSDAGWLTEDLGLIYGHNTDFANTVIHHNLLHDNHSPYAMGIYFDHLSHNAIVHHNVVWNVAIDPIRINNPSYGNLVFNNSCWKTGHPGTFDHSKRNDLFGCRFYNNVFNGAFELLDHVMLRNNLIAEEPPFQDAANRDFRLVGEDADHRGACDEGCWVAGCDLNRPPAPIPEYLPAAIPGMNLVKNACFEFGTLEGWQPVGLCNVGLVAGNGWGHLLDADGKPCPTGTSTFELEMGRGNGGIIQPIETLLLGCVYHVVAWLRVEKGGSVELRLTANAAVPIFSVCTSEKWERHVLQFVANEEVVGATLHVLNRSNEAKAWCDNILVSAIDEPDKEGVRVQSRR